jgi:hypothetical protein
MVLRWTQRVMYIIGYKYYIIYDANDVVHNKYVDS